MNTEPVSVADIPPAHATPAILACDWPHCVSGLRHLPIPYGAIAIAAGIVGLIAQIVEYSLRDPTFQHLTPSLALGRLAVPAMFVYALLAMRALKQKTVKALEQLRPVVRVTDQEYYQHTRRMVHIGFPTEGLLLVTSAAIVVIPLLVFRVPTPMGGGVTYLPVENWPIATFIVSTYVILGWLELLLLYSSITLSTELGRLAKRPLTINVFDSTELLPFGNIALLHSVMLAGLILVLIIPLGRPTELFDYLTLTLLSLGTFLTLVFPLRGVRHQVTRARMEVLRQLSQRFYAVQTELQNRAQLTEEDLKRLSNHANELEQLRRLVLAGPVWPFRNASATIRAGLVATSPLLYFLLNELMRSYVLPLLTQ